MSDADKTTKWDPRSAARVAAALHPESTPERKPKDIVETAPAHRDERRTVGSVAPVAIDAHDDAAQGIATSSYALPKRRLEWVVVGSVAAASLLLAIAGLKAAVSDDSGATAARQVRTALAPARQPDLAPSAPQITTQPPAEPAADKSGIPTVSVDTLPQTGTVRGPAWQVLFIDGAFVKRQPVTLRCGKHVAKVGWGGASQTIDVPCGGETSVK